MIFYTFGNKNDKPVIVEIFVEIFKEETDKPNVDFMVVNLGNDIKKSLINACNLFARTDLQYFKNNSIKVRESQEQGIDAEVSLTYVPTTEPVTLNIKFDENATVEF